MNFRTVMRGYDREQVEGALRAAHEAADSPSGSVREAAARALQDATFRVTLRGYDPSQVDDYIGYLVNESLLADPHRRPQQQ